MSTGPSVLSSLSILPCVRNLGLSKRIEDDQDPREAILKYAKDAEENPYWITPAYKKTQPKQVFEHGNEDERKKKKPKL